MTGLVSEESSSGSCDKKRLLRSCIVEQIEKMRKYRGISIAELGRRIGIDRKRLWYVLNGQREMRVDEFLKLCVFFDMGLGRFVTREQVEIIRNGRDDPKR